MKVGEIYRYKARPEYIVQVTKVHSHEIVCKYLNIRHTEVSWSKEDWSEDFVLMTKLERLLEGLDEI
jgi:hypothetical protein